MITEWTNPYHAFQIPSIRITPPPEDNKISPTIFKADENLKALIKKVYLEVKINQWKSKHPKLFPHKKFWTHKFNLMATIKELDEEL